MAEAKRDGNYVTTLLAVSSVDGVTPVVLWADPVTHRLLVTSSGGTPGGSDTQVQFNDGGVFGGDAGMVYDKTTNTLTVDVVKTTNNGLRMDDTDASHVLALVAGSNLTANRTFTITTGNANRTLTMTGNLTVSIAYVLGGTGQVTFTSTALSVLTLPSGTETLATLAAVENFTNKTLDNTNTITLKDTNFTLQDDADTTKQVVFQLSSIATATTRTVTFPNANITVVGTSNTQTLSGKTLTAPIIVSGGFIADANGNEQIIFNTTASAVNEIAVTNAATGTTGPLIQSSGETNVDLRVSGKGTGKVHSISGTYGDITAYSPVAAGTATLTLNTSDIHTITMPAGNITIALSNESVGQYFIINIIQDATGSRTVTWFTTIKWAGSTAPTLTTTANKIDSFAFIVASSGNYYGYILGQNIG